MTSIFWKYYVWNNKRLICQMDLFQETEIYSVFYHLANTQQIVTISLVIALALRSCNGPLFGQCYFLFCEG